MKSIFEPSLHDELQFSVTGTKLNWLRAAVLGANDGLVSVSSVVVGVAGASSSASVILTAGVAALVAGALSMAVGEYVSVSSQRDSEKALLAKERRELQNEPEEEFKELADLYEKKGLSKDTAQLVAKELTEHDVFAAHADAELGIDPNSLTDPWHAAYASALAFLSGGIIPIISIILISESVRIPLTFAVAFCTLIIIGFLSARAGGAKKRTAVIRVVLGGILAMVITFGIGKIFGVVGI